MADVTKFARKLRFALIAACLPFAAHAAPETCIDNLVGMNEAVIIDASTLVLHKPGEGYKRITVVNHPLEPDDERLHHPYALCVNDRIAPLGIERGVSRVTDITDISNAEADALRRIDFTDRERYKARPINRINFRRAGRINELCSDLRLTVFQIKQCSEMMRDAQTVEARDDIRDTVRFIIKKRQSLSNRSGYGDNQSLSGHGGGYIPSAPSGATRPVRRHPPRRSPNAKGE